MFVSLRLVFLFIILIIINATTVIIITIIIIIITIVCVLSMCFMCLFSYVFFIATRYHSSLRAPRGPWAAGRAAISFICYFFFISVMLCLSYIIIYIYT